MKIANIPIKFYLVFVLMLLVFAVCGASYAANPSDVLVSNATAQIGKSYVSGQPPNKEWTYGGIFDLDSWTGGLDCSGLVSYAGNLRRHYAVSELFDFVSSNTWNGLQSGDVIMSSGHIMVFEGRYTDANGIKRYITIEASSGQGEVVRRGPGETLQGYLDPAEYSTCDLIKGGFSPYKFNSDSTKPEIVVSGIVDGGCYNGSITVGISSTDNLDSSPYVYGEYQGAKFKQKSFSTAGNYTISVHSEDWVKNSFDKQYKFAIDKTPPTITISGASNGATYFMPVSLTITYLVTDNVDPNPTVNANYPSGTVFDSEGSYTVVVTGKDCAGNEDTKTLSFRIARRPRPDDTYSISDGTPTSITSDPFAKVGVLNRGMIGSLASILNNLKESYAVVDLPVDITSLQKYPLLIIPSDGFNGLETSQSFKDALMQYVQNGGVILSFTQERGYMFDTLPGDWQGVGYLEENGCQTYAGGIENQHVFFSGQDSVYIDANVDGYFTAWPKEGKILVRRTKNAMPCLISYPVEQGIVLASTLYSDYGYISGQINLDEKRLIRDIVSWAKDIVNPINAYNAGTLVKETVQIQNKSDIDAYSVTYNFYEPDKKLVYKYDETIASPLAPGQYAQGNLTYQLPAANCPIGIYWIKYQLNDASGNTIQAEQPTSRFAVKYNIGTVNISKDINVIVKTTQPFYPIGSTGAFEIVVSNSTNTDVPVRLRYGTGFHAPLYSNTSKEFVETVIPANGSKTFTVDVVNLSRGDYFSAGVFDQSDRTLAFGQEKFYVFYPYVKATVSTDKGKYLPEESGTISYNLSYDFLRYINKTSYEVTANIRLLDQAGTKIFEQTKTLLLTGNSFSDQLSFTTPLKGGWYIAQVEILSYGKQVGTASSYIEVLTRDFLTITPHYPVTWVIGGDNTISFDVKNISLSMLPVGAVKFTLFDPAGVIIRTEEKQFSNLPAGETAAAAFNIPLTEGKFGTYRLKYELLYLGNIYEYYADFLNQAVFNLSFDKLSYKMRENMLLNLDITNNGVFEENISVRLEIPTFGYTDVNRPFIESRLRAIYDNGSSHHSFRNTCPECKFKSHKPDCKDL